MPNIYAIYGASGCGRGIMPLLRMQLGLTPDQSANTCFFIDDGLAGSIVNHHQVLTLEAYRAMEADRHFVSIAVADGHIREKLSQRCDQAGLHPHSISAEQHVVMDAVTIGRGALFSPFTTVTSNVQIGDYFHCNLNSYVEHDCVIGDYVTFAPGVRCNGNVHIGDHAYIGTGAMIRQGVPGKPLRIGRNATIGMGAVVLNDVPDGATVVGNPARQIVKP